MRNIYSGPTGIDTPITPRLSKLRPWNWVHILAAALLLLASFWITDPQMGHAQNSVPVKPTGLTAAAGGNQAALTWTDPSDSSITSYEYLKAQVAKLTASDGEAQDWFGRSVAVDGDTMVVGAHRDDDNGTYSGSAYVFIRQSGTWSQAAKLTASDGAAEDMFGRSVAVDGDTVVVGAYGDDIVQGDINHPDSGSAYVFTKPANGWVTTSTAAKLTDPNGSVSNYLGISVAVDGDTVVIGSMKYIGSSVKVFTKPATGWATTSTYAQLTSPDGGNRDQFGHAVAIEGNTIVVGARYHDDNVTDSGSAYVFTKPASGWIHTSTAAKLTASDGAAQDNFGDSVAVEGNTIVVGSKFDDDNTYNSGSAYVFTKPVGGWITTSTAAKLTDSDGTSYSYFGNSVAVNGNTVAIGAYNNSNMFNQAGAAYIFTKPTTGWATTSTATKLTASDGTAIDHFGGSVAVDANTIVIGANADDDNGTNSGSTYVYELSDCAAVPDSAHNTDPVGANATSYTVTGLTNGQEYNFWIRATNALGTSSPGDVATATPVNTIPTAVDNTSSTDEDTSIDINVVSNDTDADGDTLSVTAVTMPTNGTAAILAGSTTTVTYTPDANYNGTDSFDYTLSDGTDTDTGTVTITVTAVNDPPVAVDDTSSTDEDTAVDINVISNDTDVDGDTLSVTQVATPSNGTAVILQGSTTTVTYTPDTDFVGTDSFTYTVSDGTDTDTGTATIIIGNPPTKPTKPTGLTATASNSRITLTWDDPSNSSITGYEYLKAQVAKLTASDGAAVDYFGESVAVDGDTIVVGAYNDDDNGTASGSAYVYVRQSGAWSQVAKLTASDGAAVDYFGESVAVDGDTIVVGAYWDDDNGRDSGSAYVFTKPDTGWTTTNSFAAKLTASDGADLDYFGESVAVDGDTIVVGAYWDDDNGRDSGSAYVFTKPGTGWTTTNSFAAKLTASDGAGLDYFGESVAVDGDTIVVGAYNDDDNGRDSGSAYVFTKPGTGWTTTSSFAAKLTASDGAGRDYFGESVAVDGDTIVVGAYNDDDNGTNSGSAYVFTKPGTGWTTTSSFAAKLTASDGVAVDNFGESVAVDGDTIVVGAYKDDDNGTNSGSAYVFTKPGTGWTTTNSFAAKLTASDGAAVDYFGESVAVDGDTIVVGAYQDDDKGKNSGSTYVYAVPAWTAVPNSAPAGTNATSYTLTGLTNDVEYSFQIRATNDVGTGPASDPATVTPTNTAPTAVNDTASTPEDTAIDNNVVANDTDADADTLSVTAVTTPTSGTAAIVAGSTTTVTYTPNANFNGTDTFDYTLSDGTDTDTGTVNLTVTAVNDPPVAVDDTSSTDEDTAIDINVVANDTDADGDTLSVTQVTTPSNGTAAIVAASTTTVTYTPGTSLVGTDTFTYTVSDGTDTATGTVTVIVGDPPAKPTGLTAAARNNQAALTWDDPSDSSITSYEYLKAQVAKLTASDGAADDHFGFSVAVDGDTMVVGAFRDNSDRGSAYVFIRQWGTWNQAAKLTASDGTADDLFGKSVAVHGDTIVIGTPRTDDNGSESGSAYVFTKPANGWTTTSTAAKLTTSDGAAEDWFGFSVAVHGDTIVVGATYDDDNGSNSGSAYVFTKPTNGWATTSTAAKLTASDGAADDLFGGSVAVHGDTIVVGASYDDDNGTDSGSAYVFTKPANGWATTSTAAKLTASDGTDYDEFGLSVTVHGDTMVVGAFRDDDNGTDSGSAYVFSKPANGWATTSTATKLTASDGAADDWFGFSIAVHEDTIVVGAVYDDDNGADSGSAYVFTKPANGWVTTSTAAKLTASDGAADDDFGGSVAMHGDTIVVGAWQDDDNGTVSGSAYVYELSDWSAVPDSAHNTNPVGANATSYTVTSLTNGQEYNFWIQANNALGTSSPSDLAAATPFNTSPTAVDDTASTPEDTAVDINVVSNDTDADGDTLSVTALTTPSNGTAAITASSTTTVTYTPNTGFVGTDRFTYTVSDGTDTDTGTVTVNVGQPVKPTGLTATAGKNQAALTWDDPSDSSITSYEYLKAPVAKLTASDGAADDHFGFSVAVDGDTMVVGAHRDNSNRGSAYVFIRQSGTWNQAAKLTASDGTADDLFGKSVAVDANTIVIGAHRTDDKGSESGSAYVFTKPANGWVTTSTAAKLTASDGAAEDWFGYSVDMDGDTIVVGTVYDDDDGSASGSAYVFTKPANGWTTTSTAAKLTAFDGAAYDYFGDSVAIHGDTIVVGAHGDDDNGTQSGSAYVFTKPANGWATTSTAAKLTASDGAADDYFGDSVAIHGDTIVVGASQDDDNGSDSGSAYVFTKPANGWATTSTAAKLTAFDGAAYHSFGRSIAMDEDTIVVGAWQDDDDGPDSGSAYVFTKPANGWTTTSTAAKLTTSDGAADDYFGTSVAMDGDTMVVGAWRDDDNGQDSGSAYVYELSDWTTVPDSAHNTNPVGANATSYTVTGLTNGQEYNFWIRANNALGTSSPSDLAAITPINTIPIAVEDNVTTAEDTAIDINVVANDADADRDTLSVTAVTTPTSGGAAIMAGSTTTVTYTPNAGFTGTDNFEYTLSDGTDTDTSTVNLTVTAVNDPPVAVNDTVSTPEDTAIDINVISNDTDTEGDTLSVTQVTAPTNGAAAIVAGSATTVTYTPNANYNGTDSFTYTVSDGTDTDTGTVTVNVGQPVKPTGLTATAGKNQAALAWNDPSNNSITGYEYRLRAQVAKLTASDGATGHSFGRSVAIDGDTMVVGAENHSSHQGAAYVFTRQSGAWSQVAKLTSPNGAADAFGYSVAVDGDTVVVSAYLDNNKGSAYVFTKPATGWTTTSSFAAKLTASDASEYDSFGYSVAVDRDTMVVGAHKDDDNGSASGSAYVFTKPGTGWVTTSTAAKLTASDATAGDNFGDSVAVDGDTVVVVAARRDDDSHSRSGSAYVFTKPAAGWTTTSTAANLTASDGATNGWFGTSVGTDGDTVVVGAMGDNDDGPSSGSAYVFIRQSGAWSQAAKLTPSDGAFLDYFGRSVAMDGDTVVVGAMGDNDDGPASGSAYVFTKPGTGWTTTSSFTAKLTASDGAGDNWFGYPVAVAGDTVAVGANSDDDNGSFSGSAYVFTKPGTGWAGTAWTAVPNSAAAETNATSYTVTSLTNDVEYSFQIRATNDVGTGPPSDPATVTPTNTAPTAVDDTSSTDEDTAVDINVVANDTDVDGDTLSLTQVTTPSNGAATIAASSTTTVTYTPGTGFVGTDSFTYTVSDGTGTDTDTDTGTVTITVTPVNTPPVTVRPVNTSPKAVDDTSSTDEDTAVDINVVSNDTDADADTLSVTALTAPNNGTAAIVADSTTTVTYTATANFNGPDSFTYTVSDGTDTDTGTVNLTVTAVNDPPIAVDDTSSTTEDTPVDINVVSNDTDVEGDTLSVTQVTTPTNGTAIIKSASTTTVTYTPNANFNGTDSFDYTVSDGNDTDTGTVTVTVTAVNDPPIAVDDTSSTDEDTAVDINVVSNDTDADEDTLSVTQVTTPSNGTAAIVAGSTTTVTYTPTANFNGTDSFTYTVSDGTDTDTGTVNVTVEAVEVTRSTSSNADLAALTVSGGALDTDFDSRITDYTMTVASLVASISLDLVTAHSRATTVVRANGVEMPTDNIPLTEGSVTIIAVVVTAEDGTTTQTYTIQVSRAASVPVDDGSGVNQNPTPSFVEGSQTTRWVTENTPGGTNIGEPILATDATSNQLSYALLGTDTASFDIDSTSAQLLTNGPLDFESKSSYRVSVGVSNSRGGHDIITVTINLTNTDEPGTVAILPPKPTVGRTMTAVLTDPDGGITDITWQWAVSSDQVVWLHIPGATSDSYRPTAGDAGQHLQVTAIYTDRAGSGQSAQAAWDTPLASPAAPKSTVTPTPAAATPSPEPAAVVPTPAPAGSVPATSAFDPATDDSGIALWAILLIAAVAIAAVASLTILGLRIIRP